MIGFAPGFAYLGGLPARLHTPRLAKPRQRVEAGAIGIGGIQASITSVPGPSGWRYIGRTPVRLFDPRRQNPFLLRAGDRIRFRRIDDAEAHDLDRRIAAGALGIEEIRS
jgi:KipI family sensor histidine kinase inhibitor